MWKVNNTVITNDIADAVRDRSNNEWSIDAIKAMLIRDYGIAAEDAEKIVQEVLDVNFR